MAGNRGVAYVGTGKVEVRNIDYPKLEHNGRKLEHAVLFFVTFLALGPGQHRVVISDDSDARLVRREMRAIDLRGAGN